MNTLYKLANNYINLEMEEKKVRVPYAIAEFAIAKFGIGESVHVPTTGRFKNYAGKGSPEQIRKTLITTAKREGVNIATSTSDTINKFMELHGIGIDCSGFVYNVLDGYLRKEKHISLDSLILRYPGILGKIELFLLQKNRVRRSNVETLTNDLNTIKIEIVKDIKPGDMIRLNHSDWRGKHIAIIVEVTNGFLTYAMSSVYTKIKGCHFGKIKIIDPNKGLESQKWEEVTKDDKNYGKDAFDPTRGDRRDSVRRLKFLEVAPE